MLFRPQSAVASIAHGSQSIAQCCGVLTDSTVGVGFYLALIPDPSSMLLTARWPARAERFTLATAAGMITGESLVGVVAAIMGLAGT